jgi:hypothetical protein
VALALTTSPAAVTGTGTTATTASFTPAASSLLVAVAVVGNPTAAATLTTGAVTDSLGSTWTRKVRQNSTNSTGSAEVWMMDAGASPAARTVTLTGSKAGVLLAVLVFTGAAATASQTGATARSASTSTNGISVTPTATGSYIVGAMSEIMVTYAVSAFSSASTVVGSFQDTTNIGSYGAFRSTNLTTSLTSTTFGFTPAPSNETEKAAVEVLAAAAGSGSTSASAGLTVGTAQAFDASTSVSTVSSTVTTPLGVFVDWSRDGNYSNTGDDVTDRVRGGLAASFGRDQATALSPTVAGRGSFTLDNASRDYSPRNTASPLFGLVKPSRPVLLQRTVNSVTYTIFRGHTDDSAVEPDVASKTVGFSLIDYLADLRGVKVTTSLYQAIRTGAAVNAVLDAAGWTGGRAIDTGATIIPWWWCNGDDAYDMLTQLVASEGPPALLTIDDTGSIMFRDRHHRNIRTASTVSQSTFTGSGSTEPVMGVGFKYSEPWSNIINDVQISVDERQPSGSLSVVWSTDETISIAANDTWTTVLSTSDPFRSPVTPVDGVDFITSAGSVVAVALSGTSGASMGVSLTAGVSGAQVTGLALRACSVPVVRTRIVLASDSTSQDAFGVRSLPSDLEPKWASYQDVVDLAALFVASRKDPLTQVTAPFTSQDTQTARLQAVLVRDLSDRVTVVEDETSLNTPFYVESISHDAADATQHAVTFGLEAVPPTAVAPFILGTSTLNSATPIAY